MRRQGGSKLDTDKSSSPHMMGNKHINTGQGENAKPQTGASVFIRNIENSTARDAE